MKTVLPFFCLVLLLSPVLTLPCRAQKIDVQGEAIVGKPGDGNNLLTIRSERSWIFRQYGTGPTTALELYDPNGQKNFLFNTTGNVGVGVLLPVEKLHVNGNIKAAGPQVSFGSSEYVKDVGSFLIEFNGTLESSVDNLDNLGTSAHRWNAVWAGNGTINTSDARFKTNIGDLPYGLDDIMKLRPVSFRWKDRPEDGPKLGLIAQEVQQVIREVVVDYDVVRDENTGKVTKVPSERLGLFYSDLIPVLIKAIQEQQQLIHKKEQRIAELENKMEQVVALEERLAKLEQLLPGATESSVILQGEGRPYLRQNAPNPFTQHSSIDYFLPPDTHNASLTFTDAAGKLVKKVRIAHTGTGRINIMAKELPAGTYVYTLLVDGRPVDSKVLIVN